MRKFLVLMILIGCFCIPPSGAVEAVDWSQPVFGVVEGYQRSGDAAAVGAAWDRVTFPWYLFQPNSAEDFDTNAVPDGWISGGQQVVGLIKGTPAWASDTQTLGAVPNGLDLAHDDPANLWGAFITKLVSHYSGRGVRHWIIWNEPDIRPGEGTVEFEGNVADYARLLKVAYLAARAVDPEAKIIIAGTTWWHDSEAGRAPYLQRLLRTISNDGEARANNWYFDAVSAHIYFTTSSVWYILTSFNSILGQFGLGGKQVWLTEFNASPRRDPAATITALFNVSLEQQADFIVQAGALALAAGADRMAVYKLYDNDFVPGQGEPWGLLRGDGSQRPAFNAYRQLIERVNGADAVRRYATREATLIIATFADRTVYIMWSETFNAGQFLLSTAGVDGVVTVSDAAGNAWQQPVTDENGLVAVIDAPGAEQIDVPWVVVAGAVRLVTLEGEPVAVRYRAASGAVVGLN